VSEERPAADATSRAALSRALRDALDRGDLETARTALAGLDEHHEGAGELPDGRRLSPEAIVGAVFDAAIAAARTRSEGTAPDRPGAEAALAHAEALAPRLGEADASVEPTLAAARRYVTLRRLTDLRTPLAAHEGPRVLVACDDYDLGEPLLLPRLRRWHEEGAAVGLRVAVLPLKHGYVRVGMRRVRAEDPEEERRALAKRLEGSGVAIEPEPARLDAVLADLGLVGQDMALFVFDRVGQLVARLSGRGLDPAELEVAVQRVGSR
jgi:hypothetical protein